LLALQSPFALGFEFGEAGTGFVGALLGVGQLGIGDAESLGDRQFFVELLFEAGFLLAAPGDFLLIGALLGEAVLLLAFLHVLHHADRTADQGTGGGADGRTGGAVARTGVVA